MMKNKQQIIVYTIILVMIIIALAVFVSKKIKEIHEMTIDCYGISGQSLYYKEKQGDFTCKLVGELPDNGETASFDCRFTLFPLLGDNKKQKIDNLLIGDIYDEQLKQIINVHAGEENVKVVLYRSGQLGVDLIFASVAEDIFQIDTIEHLAQESNGAMVTVEAIDENGYQYNYGIEFAKGQALTKEEFNEYLTDKIEERYQIFKDER